jgi:hypothetical protein
MPCSDYLQHLHYRVRRQNRKRYDFSQFLSRAFLSATVQPTQMVGAQGRLRQSALLQDELRYSWSQTEISLMKATTFDPLRGEPLDKLVDHYCQTKALKKAHDLSNLALRQYFEKNPAADADFNAPLRG